MWPNELAGLLGHRCETIQSLSTRESVYVRGNCREKLFNAKIACGWDRQFGASCPIETSEEPYTWLVSEQRVRGSKDDGQPSYFPEFVPKHGTRREFLVEFRSRVCSWMPHHQWRDRLGKQGLLVFEDRKSGRHHDAAVAAWAKAALCRDALKLVAHQNPQVLCFWCTLQ